MCIPLSSMFEAFVADLLASYLGFFLDVKREKLRISLWSGDPLPYHPCMHLHLQLPLLRSPCGDSRHMREPQATQTEQVTGSRVTVAAWKTGFVLDNVRLKVDAFDYLQLPFDIKEGIVGRIEVQVSRLQTNAACGHSSGQLWWRLPL